MITPATIALGILLALTLFGCGLQDSQLGGEHEGFGLGQDVLYLLDHCAGLTFPFLVVNATLPNVKDPGPLDQHDFQLGFKALLAEMLEGPVPIVVVKIAKVFFAGVYFPPECPFESHAHVVFRTLPGHNLHLRMIR